jgi:hypothetical protein
MEPTPSWEVSICSKNQELSNILWNMNVHYRAGFEVSIALLMKSSIFWDTTSWSPLKVNRRFEGTICLHLHCQRISQGKTEHEASSSPLKMKETCFSETLDDFQRTVRSLSQKIELYITVFMIAHHWFKFWARGIQPTPSHFIFFIHISLIFSQLCWNVSNSTLL